MKRSALQVGESYWYTRSNKWQDNTHEGAKVTIVDAGFWEVPSWGDPTPRKTTKGMGVLVDMEFRKYNSTETETHRKVISVTYIRGPYEETYALVKANEDLRIERHRIKHEIGLANEAAAKQAIELAKSIGIEAKETGWRSDKVVISAADLTNLINKAGQA